MTHPGAPDADSHGAPHSPDCASPRLRELELRMLADNLPDVVMRFDRDLRILFANREVELRTGVPLDHWIGKTNSELGRPPKPETRAQWEDALRRVFCTGERHQIQLAVDGSDGRRWMQALMVPELNSKGEVESVLTITRDVTAIVQATAQARAQNELLTTTLRSIGDGVITTDADGRVQFMNPVAEELTGWTATEAAGQPSTSVFHILHERTREIVESPVEKTLRTGEIVALANHTSLISRDGTERPIDDSGAPIRDEEGHVHGAVLVFRDVTERRRADGVRRRLAAIVEYSEDAIVAKNLDGIITDWNRAAERLYGWKAEEIIGKSKAVVIPPDLPNELNHILSTIRRGETIEHYETTRIRKDGSRIELAVTVSPILDPEGNIVGASTIARDISEQKRIERALRESEERFRILVEKASDAVALLDEQGVIRYTGHGEQGLLGYSRAEVMGTSGLTLVHPDDRASVGAAVAKLLQEPGGSLSAEFRMQHKNGAWRWIEATATNLFDEPSIGGAVVNYRDVTERRERELADRFLAHAGDILASSLDHEHTLRRVADLAVPDLADWCAVDLLRPDGTVERVTTAHVDPQKRELAASIYEKYPPDLEAPNGLGPVLRERRTDWMAEIPAALIEAIPDADLKRTVQVLGLTSYICVPLVAHDRTLGALTLVTAESKRRYTQKDVRFAEDLGRRIALAVDNSLLYQASQEEIADRLRAEKALHEHQREIEALNERLRRAMRETHHRVRNSLQMIAAMAEMQEMDDERLVPVEEFRRIASSVKALAAVHEILTQEARNDLEAQNLSARRMIQRLVELFGQTTKPITITTELDEVRLTARQASSLAVVTNELMTNAYKYGRGKMHVRLLLEGDVAALEVLDDGPGFPPGWPDDTSSQGTGLDLIRHIAQWDLGGEVQFGTDPAGGGRVSLRMPLQSDAVPA